ncbi:MAG: lipid-A-disaccharide synthase [Acidobacteria bacterium OLB17]|nr:MAG: lipid-A-disaccharide synthase [Acidobacteria bacterium OLB17]
MIVAGEASGDKHAASLVEALQDLAGGELHFVGSAGPKMRAAGVSAVVEADRLSIMGLLEVAGALPMFLAAMRKLTEAAAAERPDAAVLVDFPEFNLKLAKKLRKLGVPVVYYISPQVWAWREYRVEALKRDVELLLTILPFEKEWYERRGLEHVEYVGNPLAREVFATRSREDLAKEHQLDAERPIIALLPGSRHKEIVRILPVLLETAKLLAGNDAARQFIVPLAAEKDRPDAERFIAAAGVPVKVAVGQTYDVLNASDAAAVTSGTATLEAGIIGTPMAVVYKTSSLNYKLFVPLISVEHYGLINLIAGERIVKEFLQDEFTPQTLADEIERLLIPDVNREVRAKLKEAAEKLGHGGASKRAAEAILKLIGLRPAQ